MTKIVVYVPFTRDGDICFTLGACSIRHTPTKKSIYTGSIRQTLQILQEELGLTRPKLYLVLGMAIFLNRSHCPEYAEAIKRIVHRSLMA